ncbi:MAG TPA: hypothetical protein PLM07_17465, partial [Candidatus Rifleibacterium sp.]|nr:hypothetical protein [Candidatus Rifleibacterium sp.]
ISSIFGSGVVCDATLAVMSSVIWHLLQFRTNLITKPQTVQVNSRKRFTRHKAWARKLFDGLKLIKKWAY